MQSVLRTHGSHAEHIIEKRVRSRSFRPRVIMTTCYSQGSVTLVVWLSMDNPFFWLTHRCCRFTRVQNITGSRPRSVNSDRTGRCIFILACIVFFSRLPSRTILEGLAPSVLPLRFEKNTDHPTFHSWNEMLSEIVSFQDETNAHWIE